ncbi:DUF2493 domain-containing protein [Synechococcus sp. EJ6-Ellesmere]|uniref:DUF2493 domain-containing protein n=1 Tax=Synechococcus sp. EJ6-Ellesmere TaxID=2823734 RepID=UPI0020CC89B3|nr:DUF2493 domain-containing protein [Synechococcus sp. EJ6-Ellesmere]
MAFSYLQKSTLSLAMVPAPASPEGACCSRVIVAGGGRDLVWPHQLIAAELLCRSDGRPVHLLLHGGARGADQAIARADQQLGWSAVSLPAEWGRHGRAAGPIRNRQLLEQAIACALAQGTPGFPVSVLVVAFPGGAGTASLVQEARRLASRSPVPIAVAEVSPSAGLWSVPVGVGRS